MKTLRLDTTAAVTIGGSSGLLILGPTKPNERWIIQRITTEGNSASVPTLEIHRGSLAGPLLDNTEKANADVSETHIELFSGESITCFYALGTNGAIMQIHLEGEIHYGV